MLKSLVFSKMHGKVVFWRSRLMNIGLCHGISNMPLSVGLFVYLYVHLSVFPSVCMSICLSVCLSVCQFVCQANIHRISNMARKTYLLLWLCLLRVYQGYLGLEHNLWNPESQKHTFQECLFSWPILGGQGRS